MSKTRKDREGNIRLRADGRWEVRVTIGIDYATGEERRISRYAKTQEEAIKLLHELSFIRDHTPNNFQSVTVSEWLPFCLETYMRPTLKQSTYLSYESYIRVHLNPALGNIASVDKGTHGFSRGKTTSGVVILVGGRQPACLVCLASRRLSSVKNSEGLAGWSGALSARQRTQTYWRMSRTITRQTAAQSGPQACVPLSTDATVEGADTENFAAIL